MKKCGFLLAGMSIALMLAAGPVAAETDAIKTIAGIMANLNHFPSDEDKTVLQGIIDSDDSSEEEATIAMALSNMQHKVSGEDAARLEDLVDDESNDESARKLAGILLSINHSAGDDDKAALKAIAGM